jgi:hypothetical protein
VTNRLVEYLGDRKDDAIFQKYLKPMTSLAASCQFRRVAAKVRKPLSQPSNAIQQKRSKAWQ